MKIYLAGAISYHHRNGQLRKAINWRNKLAKSILELNREIGKDKFSYFDPVENFEKNLQYSELTVIHQNVHYLNQCDLMVVNADKLEFSPGTMFEMFYYYFKHKPVVVFGNSDVLYQPHIASSITQRFDKLSETITYLKNMYSQ